MPDSTAAGVELRKPSRNVTEWSQGKSKHLRSDFSPVALAEGEPKHREVHSEMRDKKFLPKHMRQF